MDLILSFLLVNGLLSVLVPFSVFITRIGGLNACTRQIRRYWGMFGIILTGLLSIISRLTGDSLINIDMCHIAMSEQQVNRVCTYLRDRFYEGITVSSGFVRVFFLYLSIFCFLGALAWYSGSKHLQYYISKEIGNRKNYYLILIVIIACLELYFDYWLVPECICEGILDHVSLATKLNNVSTWVFCSIVCWMTELVFVTLFKLRFYKGFCHQLVVDRHKRAASDLFKCLYWFNPVLMLIDD